MYVKISVNYRHSKDKYKSSIWPAFELGLVDMYTVH